MLEGISKTTDVLVIGAGMAGLCAASDLQSRGYPVRVVDKGRGVGGRMATRRIGEATFDHGAQYITASDVRFEAMLQSARAQRVVHAWPPGQSSPPHQSLGWLGRDGMTSVPKFLASGLNIQLQRTVVALREEAGRWRVHMADGSSESADAVVLTPPVPQTLAILRAGGVQMKPDVEKMLSSVAYERCLAVMAALDRSPILARVGCFRPESGPILWMADNRQKGISAGPAVTILATDSFSKEHWDADRDATGRTLLEEAAQWLSAGITAFSVHGWMYSRPQHMGHYPCMPIEGGPPLILAGDAFGGSSVEGAALSGWKAAEWLSESRW